MWDFRATIWFFTMGIAILGKQHLYIEESPAESWFKIKMSSCQYRKSHYGDKTVVRSSYFHNGNWYTSSKTPFFHIESDPIGGVSIKRSPYVVFFKIRQSRERLILIMGILIPEKMAFTFRWDPWPCLNIKTIFPARYGDSLFKDKTVVIPSYF